MQRVSPDPVRNWEPLAAACDLERRALLSGGSSNEAIYKTIAACVRANYAGKGILLDVGCGSGALRPFVQGMVDRYVGADLVRYESFPAECEFYPANFDSEPVPAADSFADVVVAAEIIEHLENPRALMRELIRLVKPGGLIIVTTPNQLSLLSLMALAAKHQFVAFQDVHYPAHLTALLEIDLRRMASEIGLINVGVRYTCQGRIPKTPWHYPQLVARLFPRALSDNVLLFGTKPPPANLPGDRRKVASNNGCRDV
jgi:2-polyprenyl-3-methyl-5-hydroxy-6-metoxy-1,4-benzoquinol methylase